MHIQFPDAWDIKRCGEPNGQTAKFYVSKSGLKHGIRVVICASFKPSQEFRNGPHWEIYPDKNGGLSKCDINDTDTLLKLIEGGLTRDFGRDESPVKSETWICLWCVDKKNLSHKNSDDPKTIARGVCDWCGHKGTIAPLVEFKQSDDES